MEILGLTFCICIEELYIEGTALSIFNIYTLLEEYSEGSAVKGFCNG